ncbi:hypothetical protein ACVIVD_006695 [Bradyrhizobium liaoningense]
MMTMPEIERCLRQLRLSGVRDTLQTRVLQAQGANQPFLETFSLILQDELRAGPANSDSSLSGFSA